VDARILDEYVVAYLYGVFARDSSAAEACFITNGDV
jgi:hypothetical protein